MLGKTRIACSEGLDRGTPGTSSEILRISPVIIACVLDKVFDYRLVGAKTDGIAVVEHDHVIPFGRIVFIHCSRILLNPIVSPKDLENRGIAALGHDIRNLGDASKWVDGKVRVPG